MTPSPCRQSVCSRSGRRRDGDDDKGSEVEGLTVGATGRGSRGGVGDGNGSWPWRTGSGPEKRGPPGRRPGECSGEGRKLPPETGNDKSHPLTDPTWCSPSKHMGNDSRTSSKARRSPQMSCLPSQPHPDSSRVCPCPLPRLRVSARPGGTTAGAYPRPRATRGAAAPGGTTTATDIGVATTLSPSTPGRSRTGTGVFTVSVVYRRSRVRKQR